MLISFNKISYNNSMLKTYLSNRSLEDVLQSMHEAKTQPMSQKDGYAWGIEYLQEIKKELLKLERYAKDRNDPGFFNAIKSSMLYALEAEEELERKIGKSK